MNVLISIVAFLLKADLSGQIWIAPAIAYLAILLGAFLAWLGIKGQAYFTNTIPQQPTQGSFILASMVGNTGYLGYPITLAMVGQKYFAWALFYDMLGSLFGAYAIGVAIAVRFGGGVQNYWQITKAIVINPALWSFGFGLLFRQVTIPPAVEFFLDKFAWSFRYTGNRRNLQSRSQSGSYGIGSGVYGIVGYFADLVLAVLIEKLW